MATPLVRERLADGDAPQTVDDRQLVGQHVEAFACGREAERVCGVLGGVPAGTETELDASTAHLVDLGDADGERARTAERDRRDERAEADGRRLAGEAREGEPRVRRTR